MNFHLDEGDFVTVIGGNGAGKSTKIEWLKPVFADDVLIGKATITNLVKRNAKNGLVEITIEAYNQDGDLVLTNVTEAIVKCKLMEK